MNGFQVTRKSSKTWESFRTPGATANRRWIAGMTNALALSTATPALNELKAIPFFCEKTISIDRLTINVTSAASAGGVARVGIYNNTSEDNPYPSSRIVDSGEIATDSTGVKDITITPVTLVGGNLYWFVYLPGVATATVRSLALGGTIPIFGLDTTMGTGVGSMWNPSLAYGALPSTYTAGGSVTSQNPPAIGFRIA
jgi:hypothetical protein